jgi:hypothetical protein
LFTPKFVSHTPSTAKQAGKRSLAAALLPPPAQSERGHGKMVFEFYIRVDAIVHGYSITLF